MVRMLLEPFADRVAFNGVWTIAPVAYGAGVAAAAAGESTIDEFFEEAIAVSQRLRAPMLRARTEMAWSDVIQSRRSGRIAFVEHRIEPGPGSVEAFCRRAEAALAAVR